MTHHISPTIEESREARRIVKDSLDTAEASFPLEGDVVVELGWGGDEFVVEAVDGASGFASYPNRIQIEFNTAAQQWRSSLKSTTVHEYAHVWGYERRGRESEWKWEYVLEEAFTQHAANRLAPEYQSPWWAKHDREEVAEHWRRIKAEELGAESEEAGPLFIDPKEGGYPHGLGYTLSFQLGERLLTEHELVELLNLDMAAVIRAGDELYGNE